MKYLILAISLFALPVHAVNIATRGQGISVPLSAGVPVKITFPNEGGCSIVNFSGTSATKQAYVTLSHGGKSTSGPAAASRSVVQSVVGPQTATLVATADTVVNVTVYDYKPRTRKVGTRAGVVEVTSCFA